ncbi:MAG: hypothetical protein IPP79_11900 [Chitinophagaceae bacterium]|nr:hypothetical protein [Chitinophagaceae bacterium]
MRKSIPSFLLIVLLCLFSKAQSQQNSARSSLSFLLGPSIPVGNYGSKNIQNSGAGFANTGGSAAINYSHLVTKKIGFSVSLQGQINPLAISKLEQSFNDLLIADFTLWAGTSPGQIPPTPVTGTKYPNWKFEKKSWWTASLLIGAYGEFPISKDEKTSFIANLAFGPSYVSAPPINGSSVGTIASAYHEQTGGKSWGFGSEINIGLRKLVTDKLFLQFTASHFAAPSVSFKNISASTTITKGSPGSPDFSISKSTFTGTGKQSINSLNVGFCIGFRL